MSNFMSSVHVNDFARRIRGIAVPENEKFIRELLVDIIPECPIGLLTDLARLTLNYRNLELANEVQDN